MTRLKNMVIEGRELELFCTCCNQITQHESIGFHRKNGEVDYETYRCKVCHDSRSIPYNEFNEAKENENRS